MAEITFVIRLNDNDFKEWLRVENPDAPVPSDEQIVELFTEATSDERVDSDVVNAAMNEVFSRIVKWL